MPQVVNGDKILLGRGKVYFNRLVSGVGVGERFLGNCTAFGITPTDDVKEKRSSADATSPVIARTNAARSFALAITGDEFSKENVALVLMGDNSALAQGSGTVSNEAVDNVLQGYYYKLAFRGVSSVVVTGSGGTPTYDVTDDYVVDAVTGRLYIVEGGGIADGTDLLVDYSYAADTSKTVRAGVSNEIEGLVRFIGDPASGPVWEVEVWKASFSPAGELQLISDDFGEFQLQGTVIADLVNHATEPYFRAIERAA